METYFVVTAPGLEDLTSQEMRAIGLLPQPASKKRGSAEDSGGVQFTGSREHLYRANLGLRTASRVLVRLGDFYAVSFPELVKKAARLPWEQYLTPGQPVAVRATSHNSRLYHTDAVAERIQTAIGDHFRQAGAPEKARKGDSRPEQLVVVRFVNDHCTISIDSSGELLHRRGYRLETAKAPLRETLAAAMLLASGWDARSPLLDPFCGSGTIAIEAALIALGKPPGEKRRFACMHWPGFEQAQWDAALQTARERARRASPEKMPVIQASDRDAGAIRRAQANAARAGVEGFIEFSHRAVSAISPPEAPGWVVTNPPYGQRVSTGEDVRNLYAQFGSVLRRICPGWQVTILSSDPALLAQTGLPMESVLTTSNGGIRVVIARGQVGAGETREHPEG